MGRIKNRNKDGALKLEIPLVTMSTCQSLSPGHVLQIDGTVRKGKGAAMGVQVTTTCENDTLFFTLTAREEHSGLSKLLAHSWRCVLSAVSGTPESKQHILLDSSENERDQGGTLISPYVKNEPEMDECRQNEVQMDGAHTDDDYTLTGDHQGGVSHHANAASHQDDDDNVGDEYGTSMSDLLDHDEFDQSADSGSDADVFATSHRHSRGKRKYMEDSHCEDHIRRPCRFCHKYINSGPVIYHEVSHCMLNPWSRRSLFPGYRVSESHPLPCPYCPRGFKNEVFHEEHLKHCPREPSYMARIDKAAMGLIICEICDVMCSSANGLFQHQSKTHSTMGRFKVKADERTEIPCKYCGRSFKRIKIRNQHELKFCKKNPDAQECKLCGYASQSAEEFTAHMANHTEGTEPVNKFICEICGKEMANGKSLWSHRVRHTELTPRNLKCDQCELTFQFRKGLNRHLRNVHTGVRNVRCPICGKCFKTRQNQRQHCQKVHENSYLYHCEKCGHGVDQLKYLKSHICGRVRRKQPGITSGKTKSVTITGRIQNATDGMQEVTTRHDEMQELTARHDGMQELPASHDGMQELTARHDGMQELTARHNGMQELPARHDGMQEFTARHDGMQELTARHDGMQELPAKQHGMQEVIAGYDGIHQVIGSHDGMQALTMSHDGIQVIMRPGEMRNVTTSDVVIQEVAARCDGIASHESIQKETVLWESAGYHHHST